MTEYVDPETNNKYVLRECDEEDCVVIEKWIYVEGRGYKDEPHCEVHTPAWIFRALVADAQWMLLAMSKEEPE